jgi:phospholipase C
LGRSGVRVVAAALVCAIFPAVAGCTTSSGSVTPPPSTNPIKHVIVLFQENRSFNSLFAGFPSAVTASSGPCVVTPKVPQCKAGQNVPLQQITLQTTGMPGVGTDLQHDHAAFELEFDGGKMDGFNLITLGTAGGGAPAKLYPYAYVERSQVKPYWDLATKYALADHMFSTATTDSFVAHQQIVAGTTRLNDTESLVDTPSTPPWGCDSPVGTVTSVILTSGQVKTGKGPFPCLTQYPTMADVLDAAKVSWKYYVESPFGLDFSGYVWNAFDPIAKVRCAHFTPPSHCTGFGADWKAHVSSPNTNVFSDLKSGSLPAVSWLIPTLADSDHPASGSDTGPSWVTSVVNAVGKSSYWNDTAILIVWDDWGGFYDNVAPPQLDYTSLGMRVPMIVVSPYARHGYVSHTQYEFGSILKFIEETFGAASLNTTDSRATSIGDSFDFSQKPQPFATISAKYPQAYFLSHRTFPTAKFVIDHDDGILPE